jgi:hypothetical protein
MLADSGHAQNLAVMAAAVPDELSGHPRDFGLRVLVGRSVPPLAVDVAVVAFTGQAERKTRWQSGTGTDPPDCHA